MLEQPVGHLLQHEAHVLEADLLADDVERHRREAVVHGAHGAGEHRAVAHAGVEQAQRRRAWMDVGQLHADALGDHPLLAAGGDEQQVFLPVVVKAEVLGGARSGGLRRSGRDADRGSVHGRLRLARDEGAHAVHRVGGDASAKPQPVDQLAVVHRQPPERRFRHTGAAAVLGDVAQERFAHRTTSRIVIDGK